MDLITAIHEAGHSVAFSRLLPDGYTFGVACVPEDEQEEEGALGWSSNEELSEDDDDQTVAAHDVYLCAGYAAVMAAGYSDDEAAPGCGSDYNKVQGDLAVAKSKALDLMRQPENMKAVKRISEELMRRQRLHPDHVSMLIDLSDGELPQSEYQQILALRGWHNNDPTLEPEA